MPRFNVTYRTVKRFPEGTDEHVVNLKVDSLLTIIDVVKSPDLEFITIERIQEVKRKRAPVKRVISEESKNG